MPSLKINKTGSCWHTNYIFECIVKNDIDWSKPRGVTEYFMSYSLEYSINGFSSEEYLKTKYAKTIKK